MPHCVSCSIPRTCDLCAPGYLRTAEKTCKPSCPAGQLFLPSSQGACQSMFYAMCSEHIASHTGHVTHAPGYPACDARCSACGVDADKCTQCPAGAFLTGGANECSGTWPAAPMQCNTIQCPPACSMLFGCSVSGQLRAVREPRRLHGLRGGALPDGRWVVRRYVRHVRCGVEAGGVAAAL
jgi:hypothetical protein